MIVAELRIVPVGTGSSMEKAMEKVAKALDATGLRYKMGPMGTTLEGEDLDAIFDAAKAAHKALVGNTPRIETELSIDHRLDKQETMQSLVEVEH